MKNNLILIAVQLCVLSFVSWNQNTIEPLTIGEEAPLRDYQMKNTDGEYLCLNKLNKENGYLVIFSCNTCPYVIGGQSFEGWEKEFPSISKAAEEANIGLAFVNSNAAKRREGDGIKDMIQRYSEKNYQNPYLLDSANLLADAMGAKTTPHVFLFDNDHRLVYEGLIDNTWDPREDEKETFLLHAIQALQHGREIKVQKTASKGCSIKRQQ